MRKTGFILFIIVSIPILLFAYLLWVNRPVPYVKPAYNPPKDNAWNYYERALLMPCTDPDPYPGPGKEHADEYCMPNPADNVMKIAAIRQGFGKPCIPPPEYMNDLTSPSDIGKTSYEAIRVTGRIFAREGNSLMRKGEYANALNVYLDGIYFGTDLSHGGTIRYLVAYCAEDNCSKPLERYIIDKLSASECDEALRRLQQIHRRQTKLKDIFKSDKLDDLRYWRLFTIHETQDIGDKMNPRNYREFEDKGKKIGILGSLRIISSDKRRSAADIGRYFDQWIAESSKPYCLQTEPELPRRYASRVLGFFDTTPMQCKRISFIYTSNQTRDRILTLRLSLRAYYLRNGQYPEKLSRDMSKHLRKEDLIDPFDGKPLRYRRNGSGYVLYSVGPDGKDDKGKPMPTGKHPEEKGDIVYIIKKS